MCVVRGRSVCPRLLTADGLVFDAGQTQLSYNKELELARTIYMSCIYGSFGRDITKHTVIYGVYIRLWLTLQVMKRAAQVLQEECSTGVTRRVQHGYHKKSAARVLQEECSTGISQDVMKSAARYHKTL